MAESSVLDLVACKGFQYRGSAHYSGEEWHTWEFMHTPSKLYILKLPCDWSEKLYSRVRLIDTGGVDMWQGGIDTWHSKAIFFASDPDVIPVEINFSSYGFKWRGEGELFDYSQVEIRRAHKQKPVEQSYGDIHWYYLSHTVDTVSVMSFTDIVDTVAEIALDYPYFTWDEGGTFQDNQQAVQDKGIRECHCRIFSDRVLRSVVAEKDLADLPLDMDDESRVLRLGGFNPGLEEPSNMGLEQVVVESLSSPHNQRLARSRRKIEAWQVPCFAQCLRQVMSMINRSSSR